MTSTTLNFPAFANHIGWSDITPYEVVRVISDKCIEVRMMNAERDKSVELSWITGGFAGVCVNEADQKWDITPNPYAAVERVRLHKDGRWYGVGKRMFKLAETPIKFYNFNF